MLNERLLKGAQLKHWVQLLKLDQAEVSFFFDEPAQPVGVAPQVDKTKLIQTNWLAENDEKLHVYTGNGALIYHRRYFLHSRVILYYLKLVAFFRQVP